MMTVASITLQMFAAATMFWEVTICVVRVLGVHLSSYADGLQIDIGCSSGLLTNF